MMNELTIKLSGPDIESIIVALENEIAKHKADAKRYKAFRNQVIAEENAEMLEEILRKINNQL